EMLGVDFIVDREILFHIRQKHRDVDNVIPARARVLQDKTHILKDGMALFLDIVTQNVAIGVESDARNFFASTHARPDAGKEEKIADALGVWEGAHWFRCARTFERFAHRAACAVIADIALMNSAEFETQPNKTWALKSEAS